MIRRRDFVMTGAALGGWAAHGPAAPGLGRLGGADRGRRRQGVRRHRDQHRLGGRPPGARPNTFSGPKWKELTGIDVKVIEVATEQMFTKILQEHRAGTGRLRRAQRDPVLDARPGARRRARGARPLRRQVRLPRGAAGDRTRLPRQPDDGGRQDLRLPRRRRRLRPVLPHRRPGRSQDPGRLQGEVRQRPAGAAHDLAGVRSGRRR